MAKLRKFSFIEDESPKTSDLEDPLGFYDAEAVSEDDPWFLPGDDYTKRSP